MGRTDVFRQLRKCVENLNSFADGQVYFKDCDWDQLTWVTFEISPKDGVYSGATFLFEVCFKESYPREPPDVSCKTPIFHPNIDTDEDHDNVCVSFLDRDIWTSSTTLQDLIQGLLFLLHNPNCDSALGSPNLFAYLEDDDESRYDSRVDRVLYKTHAKEIYEERKNPFWKPDSGCVSKDFFEPAFNKGTREEWQRVGNERLAEWKKNLSKKK